jgi:cytoskeleton protein RodZ
VRGFVRNYAKLVDIPAEPLLKLLNARLQPSAPLREGQASNGISPVRLAARERASRLAVVGGAMVLLLVFAVLGWWTMRPSGPQVAPPPQVESLRPASSPPPVAAPAKVVPPQEAAPAAQAPIEVAATAPASEAAATTPASTAAGAPSTPAPLHFNFRGRSWVQVTQADGSVLMSRTNSSGERTTVEGTPPYALVIGNASKVDLEFRGRTIDLRASTGRGDIARLRLE